MKRKQKIFNFNGEMVKRWRIERGLSQGELAKLLKTQTNFIQNIELGNDLFVGSLCRIAAALNVHPKEFFVQAQDIELESFLAAKRRKGEKDE